MYLKYRLVALSAQAFVVLDLVLMAAAFAAARSGNAGLMCYSFGLHFLAALTVRLSSKCCCITLVFDFGVKFIYEKQS